MRSYNNTNINHGPAMARLENYGFHAKNVNLVGQE